MSQGLSDIQSEFVRYIVREGCNPTEAARRAGYSHPSQRGYELVRKENIVRAIRSEQERLIDGDLTGIALRTLKDVMQNPKSPPNARVSASRAVLEAGGYFKRVTDDLPLHEKDPLNMTADELEKFVADSRDKVAFLADIRGNG